MARTEDAAVNLVVANGRQVLDDAWVRRLGVDWRHIGSGMTDDEVSELGRRADVAAGGADPGAGAPRARGGVPAPSPAAWGEAGAGAGTPPAAARGALRPHARRVDRGGGHARR